LFITAPVHPADDVELKWSAPDEEGLKSFLVDKMGFSAERVASGIKRLQEAQLKKSQQRMDSFFTVLPKTTDNAAVGTKRKVDEKAKASSAKKGPGGGGKFGKR
jgi:flap endonuclease-1